MSENLKHLLIVEDEEPLRSAVAARLIDERMVVVEAATGEEAVSRLAEFAFDLVLTDLRLPGSVDGLTVLEAALDRYPDLPVIIMTGFGTVRDAVAAIKRGAADFITKPFQHDELMHVIGAALERQRLRTENAFLRSQLDTRYRFEGLIGQSLAMRELCAVLEAVAPTQSTVLVTGDTGTGKELVARAIHHNSTRRPHRFVALNCSAIPETLLEAELFGHVRGAFTGAVGTRQGRFEQAHRGTLFLDEVGTMSMALQTRLLRVLQEREFERVGDSHPMRVDVRVIAATNSDLEHMVKEGTFREDLFYRLNVIPVRLPALRERRDDIPLLVRHFLDRFGRESNPPRQGLVMSQEALRLMMAYSWPGNVRQLENVVERAVALSPGRTQIEVSALPADLGPPGPSLDDWHVPLPGAGIDLDAVMARIERNLIEQSLERTHGNKVQAARLLNVKRTTLVERLKRLDRPVTPPAGC